MDFSIYKGVNDLKASNLLKFGNQGSKSTLAGYGSRGSLNSRRCSYSTSIN